jgi:hypothetical protein
MTADPRVGERRVSLATPPAARIESIATLRYLLGNMGGDEVIVVGGTEKTAGREREIARAVLADRSVRALEMVFVYPRDRGAMQWPIELAVRIIDSTTLDYIAICGGVTQVLGHILSHQDHVDHLSLDVPAGRDGYTLITDSYRIPIEIIRRGERPAVHACMKEVAADWLSCPYFDLTVSGVPASFMGEFIFVEEEALSHAGIDASERDRACYDCLAEIHRKVVARTGASPAFFYSGTYRKIRDFRYVTDFIFFPETRVRQFACGSGSTALALMLALRSAASERGRRSEYRFEVKSRPRGGLGETTVSLEWNGEALEDASFTHDRVEILRQGTIRLQPLAFLD